MALSAAAQILYISTFPPRRCGLATYTSDLLQAVSGSGLVGPSQVMALVQGEREHTYGPPVVGELLQERRADYARAARLINGSPIQLVNLQHEFGIFGGTDGEYVLDLLDALEKPLVTTLHTVLSEPDDIKLHLTRRLAEKSQTLVVMARRAVEILRNVYRVAPEKITLIQHGAPERPAVPREVLRRKLGLADRFVLCTMGLINPGKGIEYALEGLPEVARRHPEVLYLVLGQTHPGVKRHMGEAYRDRLRSMVSELDLDNHVRFVDTYLNQAELVEYLVATDVYLTPYLGREQIVSGTLAYAFSLGKAIVSTPYFYAEELLGDGGGILIPFRDSYALREAVASLLAHPERRAALEARAAGRRRAMTWSRVGQQYARLFLKAIHPDNPLKTGPLGGAAKVPSRAATPALKMALPGRSGAFRFDAAPWEGAGRGGL